MSYTYTCNVFAPAHVRLELAVREELLTLAKGQAGHRKNGVPTWYHHVYNVWFPFEE